MLVQIRILTIHPGMLDSYVQLYDEQLEPIQLKLGLRTFPRLVHRARNEMFWIRAFADEAQMAEQRKLYSESPERAALGEVPHSHVAKVEDYYLTLTGGENLTSLDVAARLWPNGG